MGDGGNYQHGHWGSAPRLSGDRAPLAAGTIDDAEFRLLADNIPTLCWIANGDGYIVWYNRLWHEYTGTTPAQMEGWGWQSVHDAEKLPAVMERWTNSIRTGEPFEMTFPLRGADGVFRPFLTRVQPVRDSSGALVRWFGVNIEISTLRETEERYRQVFENAAVGMIEIDAAWNILKSNEVYRNITGRSEEEILGANCLAFTHPEDVSAGEDALRAVASGAAGRLAFEKRYIRPSGDIVWVRSSLSRVSGAASADRFLKVVEDISEVRRAREVLRDESQALEILNQTAAQVAAELDLSNVVQLVTDAGVKLTRARFGAFFYNTVDEAGESLMLYTLSGADRSEFERFGHPRATPVFAPTFKGEGVVRSDDITADPRYGRNAPNRGMPRGHLPVRSYLAVPVASRSGEVIGGLFFGHPDAGVLT
jgi:PAS domain S-box-containing protein